MIRDRQLRLWYRPSSSAFSTRLNSVIAAASLIAIVGTLVLLWPLENLGYSAETNTHRIVYIEPTSAADKAGLQVGDQILALYDRTIDEVSASFDVIRLIGPHPIPITVLRDGQIISVEIERRPPSLSFQISKLAMFFLAAICWGTGYLLGVVRQHVVIGSPLVATFWLCMAAVTGTITFASFAAYPIYTCLVWVTVAIIAPFSVYIHLFYPPRLDPESSATRRIGLFLFAGTGTLSTVLTLWSVWQGMSLLELDRILVNIAPLSVVVALAGSALLLYRAYRITSVAHVRRQIRLIMISCLGVLLIWLFTLAVSVVLPGDYVVFGQYLPVLVGAVPLAYLVGGRVTDLYRLDRVAGRIIVHLATATCIGLCLAASSQLLGLSNGTLSLVLFVASYRPAKYALSRILPVGLQQDFGVLEEATQSLSTTLSAPLLSNILIDGVQAQFHQPAIALFLGDIAGANTLKLVYQERIGDLPAQVEVGTLTDELSRTSGVIESRTIQDHVTTLDLSVDEQRILLHPAVALWGPILHPQGHLLGLLLLGMRGDLDPYRSIDQQALQRLLTAASLAFTNSAAYAQQVEDQAEIRQLYQQLQEAQDVAAKELARYLHDEVINVTARANIRSLRQLSDQLKGEPTHVLIAGTLEREKELIYQLRVICEQLHPLGIDDPLGLPTVLNMEVERQGQMWDGQCSLDVKGTPVPLEPRTQYEAFRIAREAISNSIKHAEATEIKIELCYPDVISDSVQLTIRDNGYAAKMVESHGSQRGLRYMRESARRVGGTVAIEVEPHRSTVVRFSFPTIATGTL